MGLELWILVRDVNEDKGTHSLLVIYLFGVMRNLGFVRVTYVLELIAEDQGKFTYKL